MIDAHRGAFEYDWRTRFHLPLQAVGRRMSWGEAYRLTQILVQDPSSHVAASLAGLEYPITRVDLVLRDLYDLTHAIAAGKKRPKPYPRPEVKKKRVQPDKSVTQDQIVAALRMAGHTAPLPTRAA